MTESEQIDEILNAIVEEGDFIKLHFDSTDVYKKAVRTMLAYGLIVRRDKTFDVTQLGIEAHNTHSFDKWRAAKEKREEALHQATIKSAEATVDAAKSAKASKYAAYISAVAAIVAFTLPPLLTKESDASKVNPKIDSSLSAMNARVDTLYSQLKAQSQILKAKAIPLQMRKPK